MSKRLLFASGIIIVSLAFNATTFAAENISKARFKTRVPAIVGTVASINGSNITLNTKKGGIYIVDASNTTIMKSTSQIKMSDVSSGDTLMVIGEINNNNIKATKIVDGIVKSTNFKATYFVGKITSINGSTFLIQPIGKKQPLNEIIKSDGNTIYTKGGKPSSLADIALGQTVIITGTESGDTITAASISIKVNKVGTKIIGNVETISKDLITVKDNNSEIYTVDISKAKIKNRNKIIQVGNKVIVFGGQSSGTTNILATIIRKVLV